MMISQGLVGPKGMANAVPDGQQVNIPALLYCAMGGRRVVSRACYWIHVVVVRTLFRKIRMAQFKRRRNAWVRPCRF